MDKRYSKILVFILIATSFFTAGLGIGQSMVAKKRVLNLSSQETDKMILDLQSNEDVPEFVDSEAVNFDLFWDVWKSLRQRYYKEDDIDDAGLFYGAVKGMVRALDDPYTVFFNPEEALEFNKELEGKFEGIGAEIGIKHDVLTIIAPLPGTPAENAGLLPGDKVFAIDGTDTLNISVDMAVSKIRGPAGTKVVLTILHKDAMKTEDVTITRGEIIIPTVSLEFKGTNKDIAYIRIFSFVDDTAHDFRKEVNNMLKQEPKALILDLRSNPGGYLDTSVEMASYWIEKGKLIVTERFYDNQTNAYKSLGRGKLENMETVVLVNEGSASASEIVAGALRDHGKAVIVGEETFGKGSVQDYSAMRGGSALKITIAEWLTPNDVCINKEGIAPDIEIEKTVEDYNADLDPQLDKAIELLE